MKRFLPLAAIFLFACTTNDRNMSGQVMAYVPVYASLQSQTEPKTEAPKATAVPGKIYVFGSYLFQVDQQSGIHVIDNTNPAQAHKIAFLNIPFCTEIAIKQNFLYTNNLNDLVVFDLTNIAAPKLVKRLAKAFPLINQTYPPFSNVAFECADPSKGVVVSWEQKLSTTANCRR